MLQQLAALISAPINDARRLEAAQQAAELGRLLGGVVEPADVLERFRDDGVGLVGADRVVLVGADEANADDDVCDEIPPDVRAMIATVARSGSPQYLTDRPDSSSMVWAVLPVTSASRRFGVMVAGFDDPQPFDDVQQSFLADMTGRLGAALERSEAYANEQTARRDAEKASARWRDLQGLAAELARAATRRRVAQTLLRNVLASGHLDSGLVAMYATRPQVEVLAHSRALRSMQGELAGELVKLLSGIDGRARNGLLHYVDVADMAPELREPLAADGVTAVTGVAIMAGARQVGMLVLARRRGARGSHDEAVADVELLDAQVAMAGATLQRAARYDSEHAIADTLQRSMLELPPLTVARLRWAVRYRAGSAGLAGGDWYDLIGLDEQRVAIVVGDVVGRGVEAAASMGQLRSAVRALARQIERPAALVTAVSEFTASTGPGRYASLAYLVLDTHSGQLDFAIAGHPPPIVQRPDGEATQLRGALGPVLGVGCGRTDASLRVTPGSRLVVYTDGLVERRGESLDAGIARLVAALRACPPGAKPDDVCGALIDELVPDAGPDDIAIVAVELDGDEPDES